MASKSYPHYTFQRRIAINDVAKQIDSFLKQLTAQHSTRARTLTPTLIGLDTIREGRACEPSVLRSFFKQLRPIMSKHFVRFVVEPNFAAESDNHDVFYVSSVSPAPWCDAMWTIHVVDANHVDIGVSLPSDLYHCDLLFDFSHHCKTHVAVPEGEFNREQVHDITTAFLCSFRRAAEVKELLGDVHVMMVPTRNQKHLTPVPLIGMNYFDGRRRYGQCFRDTGSFLTNVCKASGDQDECGEHHAVHSLLNLIEDGEEASKGLRRTSAMASYGLAELLFGVYAKYNRDSDTRHDILVFKIEDGDMFSPIIRQHRVVLNRN
jgi:hypothetical protein